MTENVVTIEVAGPLAEAIEVAEASGRSVVLVREGVRYRVEREPAPRPASDTTDKAATGTGTANETGLSRTRTEAPRANHDPENLRAGIRAAAGTISEEEAERWIQDLYRWREEGSRPWDRP